jgi:predicted DsbA family dithiol-disulfide isomerase
VATDATSFLDLICPFCRLADAVLERLEQEGLVRVEVRPFEIHPETPRGGLPLAALLGKRREALWREIGWLAEETGVRMSAPERLPQSRLALEALEMARAAQGEEGAVRFARRAFRAYFEEGRDLGDEAVLRALATEMGLPRDLQDRCFLVRGFGGAVDAARREGESRLVTAVPVTFIGGAPLAGYQPAARIRQAIERMRR